WANSAVYRVFGEEPPARRGAAAGTPPPALEEASAAGLHGLEELAARATAAVPGWQRLTLALPAAGDDTVEVAVDCGTGGQPQLRHELLLDRATGEVLADERFAGTPGRRARSLLRFLHTGEALGWAGQTVAGIVSGTSTVMVWTGLALAWRRPVRPRLARRSAAR